MRTFVALVAFSIAVPSFAFFEEAIVRAKSHDVVLALKEKNFAVLAAHMGPKKLRFAPYVYLNSSNRMFSKSQVTNFFSTSGTLNWGDADGTGDPILMTRSQYANRFIYARDFFTSATVSYNVRTATGNTPSNFATVYPGRAFVEYYVPATNPGDLDWRAIDIIWQKDASGIWRLVAIANDEWTT